MNVNEKYTFYVTHNAATRQVYPAMDDLIWEWQLERDEVYYRKTLSGNLVFINNPKRSIDDFDYFQGIEDSADRCNDIEIEVRMVCGGVETVFYNGLLQLSEGSWDIDKCVLEIPITPDDEYTCIYRTWDEEQIFTSVAPSITATNFIGAIETATCIETNVTRQGPSSACLSGGEWTLLKYEAQFGPDPEWLETTIWVREKVTGGTQPPGDGWVSEGADWVREVEVQFVDEANEADYVLDEYEVAGSTTFEADNGKLLGDVIEFLNPCPSYTVVSNFFSINPDGTEPANAAYTEATAKLDAVAIWQKSDIKRAAASNNATKLRISFKDLYENLRNIFNIRLFVDGTTLRIEHLSYFTDTNGLDLVTQKPTDLTGTHKYSYDTANYTRNEKFAWMDGVSPNFEGFDIIYDNNCIDPEARPTSYNADLFTTDLDFILDFADEVDDDGFFLANLADYGGSYYIQKEEIVVSGTPNKFNGHLSRPNLHDNYWRHGRVFLDGTMNDSADTFTSTIRSKEQARFGVTFCCDEILTWDPLELMNTELGWGQVKRATYSTKLEQLNLELLHDA